jgi:hypothetical protein
MGDDRKDLNRQGAKSAKPDHRLDPIPSLVTSASGGPPLSAGHGVRGARKRRGFGAAALPRSGVRGERVIARRPRGA